MPIDIPPTDPSRCPLCGGDNRCALEIERTTGVTQGPCWCSAQTFSPELLGRLPARAQGKACICASCLTAFNTGLSATGSAA